MRAQQEHTLSTFCLQELLDFEFDHKYMMRGLIIDKKRGNILKMDRHKYVKVAFHGFKKLSREERLATYALQRVSWKPAPSAYGRLVLPVYIVTGHIIL